MPATGYIRPVGPPEISADVVDHVLDVAERAAAALDLPHDVTVELFRECEASHPAGFAIPPVAVGRVGFHVKSMPGVVFVWADLMTPDRFERVITHELRHDWQRVNNHDGSWDDGDVRERDAIEYAVSWLGPERYEATEEGVSDASL